VVSNHVGKCGGILSRSYVKVASERLARLTMNMAAC